MQMTNKKILVIAIILSLITSFMIYSYINSLMNDNDMNEYIKVVVAENNIETKTIISNKDVKLKEIMIDYVSLNAYTNINDVVGKYAKENIIQGEQVISDRIVNEDKMILSYKVPEGRRAVSIHVNEAVMVADFIRPGDYIDVMVTFDKYEIETGTEKIIYPRTTKVILQNILVLGMGQQQDVPDEPRVELPQTVTLAVTLEDAEKLAFSEETGVLKMALRRVGDESIMQTPGVIRENISEKGRYIVPK